MARCRSLTALTAQPTTNRANRSSTAARCSFPLPPMTNSVRRVAHPALIRPRRLEPAVQEIRRHRLIAIAHGRASEPLAGAVEAAFGIDIDYAVLEQIYGQDANPEKRYSPAVCLGCDANEITGSPDPKHISTSYMLADESAPEAARRQAAHALQRLGRAVPVRPELIKDCGPAGSQWVWPRAPPGPEARA
jgi:hypothetical protein